MFGYVNLLSNQPYYVRNIRGVFLIYSEAQGNIEVVPWKNQEQFLKTICISCYSYFVGNYYVNYFEVDWLIITFSA